ncbi:nitroreductase family deazaflavin-dependent oxidoreductase [Streptomyces sp. NBC_00249]|uniref:nitroreductase/quinone reductase family protein n=1 Tax=Streptomyces sp. NBC_00249 TaxID=2975690 RepID=UPI00225000D3|nr:nitroreductase/quinone reductase family protein [Streptomyces sp. NBC_00249]MCX5198522.1 nitroreductase family deazaflavin-dependent oxidoreductase [Streptomyces sp. NBC_00249]
MTPTPLLTEPVEDSANPWVAEHIRRFEETAGRPRPGFQDLLLTTRGRRSGTLRRTALVYVRAPHPDAAPATGSGSGSGTGTDPGPTVGPEVYVLTASNAGADRHPAWYLNLAADPAVILQVGAETFPGLARRASPEEEARLWPVVVAAMPSYAAYREATDREIPLVLVTRTA